VGAELREDDGVGMRIGRILDAAPGDQGKLRVHYGSSAPENCTGPIRTQAPSHLVLIDAAHLGGQPGDVALLERDQIVGTSFSTHTLPLNVIIDFIASSNPQLEDVFLIGIQPKAMGFDEPLTDTLEQVAQDVASALREAVA
jgi:hydrogenase 3 maturation protease